MIGTAGFSIGPNFLGPIWATPCMCAVGIESGPNFKISAKESGPMVGPTFRGHIISSYVFSDFVCGAKKGGT